MICTELWNGQGLGNQLHSYVMCRVLALDKSTTFGIMGKEKFKGTSFMDLDFGNKIEGGLTPIEGGIPLHLPNEIDHYYCEKSENATGIDVRDYDWDGLIHYIRDKTKIEGYWQGEKYYQHHLSEIRKWLKVKPLRLSDNICVISFRGGEYTLFPELFLPQKYWDKAIKIMRGKYPKIVFEVHTDDIETAHKFFPDFKIIRNIGENWRKIRYAKHLIVSNSSFHILPSLLGEAKEIIAPLYHAGHNKGFWQFRQNQYQRYTYI